MKYPKATGIMAGPKLPKEEVNAETVPAEEESLSCLAGAFKVRVSTPIIRKPMPKMRGIRTKPVAKIKTRIKPVAEIPKAAIRFLSLSNSSDKCPIIGPLSRKPTAMKDAGHFSKDFIVRTFGIQVASVS